MNLRTLATAVVAVALVLPGTPALAGPAPTSTPFGVSSVANPGVSVLAATKKPKATVTATFTTLPTNNKVSVQVTSNAKQVQVKYRTAKNKKRALNRKVRRGAVTITLPAGSKSITVRAKATSRLATSPWTAATPPTPPVVTPPVVSPPVVTPPVVSPPVEPAPDTTAPDAVSSLSVDSVSPTSISLTWSNPGDADLAEVLVRRATGPTAPASPTTGAGVPLGSPTATAVTDSGLAEGTQYSYAVFTRDPIGNTSAAATVTATTASSPLIRLSTRLRRAR